MSVLGAARTAPAQVEIHARQGEAGRQARRGRRRGFEAKHAATELAAEMNVRRMLTGGGRRVAENPAGVGILVRQPAVDEPVENTIEGNPVERRGA